MIGLVYNHLFTDGSETYWLCVERKVHLTCRKVAGEVVWGEEFSACDKRCFFAERLADGAEKLVDEFLESGRKPEAVKDTLNRN